MVVKQRTGKHQEHNKETYILLIDFVKSFDSLKETFRHIRQKGVFAIIETLKRLEEALRSIMRSHTHI